MPMERTRDNSWHMSIMLENVLRFTLDDNEASYFMRNVTMQLR